MSWYEGYIEDSEEYKKLQNKLSKIEEKLDRFRLYGILHDLCNDVEHIRPIFRDRIVKAIDLITEEKS